MASIEDIQNHWALDRYGFYEGQVFQGALSDNPEGHIQIQAIDASTGELTVNDNGVQSIMGALEFVDSYRFWLTMTMGNHSDGPARFHALMLTAPIFAADCLASEPYYLDTYWSLALEPLCEAHPEVFTPAVCRMGLGAAISASPAVRDLLASKDAVLPNGMHLVYLAYACCDCRTDKPLQTITDDVVELWDNCELLWKGPVQLPAVQHTALEGWFDAGHWLADRLQGHLRDDDYQTLPSNSVFAALPPDGRQNLLLLALSGNQNLWQVALDNGLSPADLAWTIETTRPEGHIPYPDSDALVSYLLERAAPSAIPREAFASSPAAQVVLDAAALKEALASQLDAIEAPAPAAIRRRAAVF